MSKKNDQMDQSAIFDVAGKFINAFYSFNEDSLQSMLMYADSTRHSIRYYQKWAECGNYKVVKRNIFIKKNDSLILCPITVKDDLIGALELDFHVTDTFHLTIIDEQIRAIETSSNDPELFYKAKDWIKLNRPELIEKACEGASNACECVKATVEGFVEFKQTIR